MVAQNFKPKFPLKIFEVETEPVWSLVQFKDWIILIIQYYVKFTVMDNKTHGTVTSTWKSNGDSIVYFIVLFSSMLISQKLLSFKELHVRRALRQQDFFILLLNLMVLVMAQFYM